MAAVLPSGSFAGKTYTLRPDEPTSDNYCRLISQVADTLLSDGTSLSDLLDTVRWLGMSKRNIRRLLSSKHPGSDAHILQALNISLAIYTTATPDHLKRLSAFDRLDRTLASSREQYHLFMLEIELGNRLYIDTFRAAGLRLAMLPHCLRDMEAECQAAERDLDYVCKGCTERCNVNLASKMLRLHRVKPYIWMDADLKSLFRKTLRRGETLGVLGIACVPELAKGMRMCHKHGVPAVGVPLDANRCARWWGRFYPHTAHLKKLELLLAG